PMSTRRLHHAALRLADGRVLLTGGITTGEGHDLGISDSAEVWEPRTGHFRRLAAPMSIPRMSHTMTLLPDGRVLVVGGHSTAVPYRLAEIFDPQREVFMPIEQSGAVRAEHVAHLTPDGRHVLVLGGETVAAGSDDPIPLASALRFDRVLGLFEPLPPLSAPRTLAGSVMLPSGKVLLFGGQERVERHSASAERYDPAAGGQVLAALDGERAYHSVNRLPDGRVLVVGGESRAGALAATVLGYH
ncbi:MAG: hypothetical protein IH590_08830, partial [Aquamicrobium sp.]|nr:hypothetical protein [Aquamicrobium sp.]